MHSCKSNVKENVRVQYTLSKYTHQKFFSVPNLPLSSHTVFRSISLLSYHYTLSLFNTMWPKLFLWIPTVWSKLIWQKISILQSLNQPLDNKTLGKMNMKYCQITRWSEINKSAVKYDLTLDQYGLNIHEKEVTYTSVWVECIQNLS